jgi:hypothetical protein
MAVMMLEESVRRMKDEMQRMNETTQQLTKKVHNIELNILHLRQEVADEVTALLGNPKKWHEELLAVIDTRKELESIEEGFYDKVRQLSELRNHVSQIENIVQTHEERLTKIDEALRQREEQPISVNETEQDVSEGKPFSEEVKKALRSAHQALQAPSLMPQFVAWLTEDQRRLLPQQLDLLAAAYLLKKSGIVLITTTTIESLVTWMKRGQITSIATGLVALGFLSSRDLGKDEWLCPGSPPRVFDLTDRALRMFVPCGSASTGALHRDMEMQMLEEAFRSKPPRFHVCVRQIPGQLRCDVLLFERIDSKTFDYPGAVGQQVETPEEVRAHSNGQVLMNMILPFTYGLRRVIIVCLPDSIEKLTETRSRLPSWLTKNIEIRAVEP